MTDVATVEELSVAEAERLTSRIGLRLESMADSWSGALPLIREAIERNAYLVLGYPSHGAYVAERWGNALSKLGVEMRREVVRELSDAGLSTRAIAPVFGVSRQMISKDIRANEVATELPPDPEPTHESEDYWSPDTGFVGANPITGEVHDAPTVTEHTVMEKTKVTIGLDGKSYEQKPREPRRSSIIDDARNAGWQLRKAVERLQRIQEDDRFTRNKAEIMAALQPHLDLANEVLADL